MSKKLSKTIKPTGKLTPDEWDKFAIALLRAVAVGCYREGQVILRLGDSITITMCRADRFEVAVEGEEPQIINALDRLAELGIEA